MPRLLLLLTVGWTVVGTAVNYLRSEGRQVSFFVAITMWASIAGVIAYSVIWQKRRVADYGFSFQRGGVASLAILAVIHVYLVISGKLDLSVTDNIVLRAWGAFMEEIMFRVILIDNFIRLMDGIRAKALWAILVSSVLFTVPHLVSKSPSQIPGLFFAALVLGYVYYKSRSILLPGWIHGVANAGHPGGILIAAAYCVISAAGLGRDNY